MGFLTVVVLTLLPAIGLWCLIGNLWIWIGSDIKMTWIGSIDTIFLGPMVGATSTEDETGICLDEVNAGKRNSDTWTWVLIFALLVTWCFFAYVMWMFWRKFQQELGEHDSRLWYVENDIYYCWKQVAGQEEYIAQQGSRIDTLRNQVRMSQEQVLRFNENSAMDHDYIVGLHYAVVEAGGFVRFPLGVEARHLLSMSVQERGNLVSHGAASYRDLVRQRARATPGQSTDVAMDTNDEAGESESGTDDADVSATNPPQTNPLQNLLEELKVEHRFALENGQERDAIRIQHMTMEILQAVQSGGINPTMVDEFYNRTATMYQDLADKAQSENRTQSALYYGRRGSDYRGDA